MSGSTVPTYEHDEPLPEGDGILVPAADLPSAVLGSAVTLVHRPTGRRSAGIVVAFDERDGETWVAVRYR
jgi:hypothetical protein